MKHGMHMYLMVGLAALVGVLVLTGVIGFSWGLLLWLGGCMAMMFFMMRSMGGGHGAEQPEGERTHTSHERLG